MLKNVHSGCRNLHVSNPHRPPLTEAQRIFKTSAITPPTLKTFFLILTRHWKTSKVLVEMKQIQRTSADRKSTGSWKSTRWNEHFWDAQSKQAVGPRWRLCPTAGWIKLDKQAVTLEIRRLVTLLPRLETVSCTSWCSRKRITFTKTLHFPFDQYITTLVHWQRWDKKPGREVLPHPSKHQPEWWHSCSPAVHQEDTPEGFHFHHEASSSTKSQHWSGNAGIYLTDGFGLAGGHKNLSLTANIYQIFDYF